MMSIRMHTALSCFLHSLLAGHVNNVLLQTSRTSFNKTLLQLINVFHTTTYSHVCKKTSFISKMGEF